MEPFCSNKVTLTRYRFTKCEDIFLVCFVELLSSFTTTWWLILIIVIALLAVIAGIIAGVCFLMKLTNVCKSYTNNPDRLDEETPTSASEPYSPSSSDKESLINMDMIDLSSFTVISKGNHTNRPSTFTNATTGFTTQYQPIIMHRN